MTENTCKVQMNSSYKTRFSNEKVDFGRADVNLHYDEWIGEKKHNI